jgi:hypothetical protein
VYTFLLKEPRGKRLLSKLVVIGDVMVCVLPLDPRIAGSNPVEAMDFQGPQKSTTHIPSEGRKAIGPCRKILRHVKNFFLQVRTKVLHKANSYFFRPFLLFDIG